MWFFIIFYLLRRFFSGKVRMVRTNIKFQNIEYIVLLQEPFLKLQFALRDTVSVLTKIDPFEFISRNLINVIWNLAQQQLPCSKIGKATHFAFWIGAACNIGMTPNAAAFTRFVTYLSSSVTSVASWRSLKSKSIILIMALM